MSQNAAYISKEICKLVRTYLDELTHFSDDLFLSSPPEGGWSLSELYCHIAQANNGSLLAIEKCIHGQAASSSESTPFLSRVILYIGRLPGQKYKAPEKIAAMVKKISKEEAKNQLIKFTHRLEETLPKLPKASESCKVKHPRLGMLNAYQWLRFIEIHSNHHLKQLSRIKKQLG